MTTPLWKADLVLPVRSMTGYAGRLLRGVEPTSSASLPEAHAALSAGLRERPQLLFDRQSVCATSAFIFVNASDNSTYFFNGGRRDSDSSAEFLCHAIAATVWPRVLVEWNWQSSLFVRRSCPPAKLRAEITSQRARVWHSTTCHLRRKATSGA